MAVKKIANAFDNHMDAKRTLREIKLLRHLDHENVSDISPLLSLTYFRYIVSYDTNSIRAWWKFFSYTVLIMPRSVTYIFMK